MEKIIQTKSCKKCSSNFDITDKDLEFYKKISPKFDGKIYEIPAPTFCPECRQQRRLSFRNERKLYKRDCDATGKQIISIYSPDKNVKVYNQETWWSDSWYALDYGINFDFKRGFFEQFDELMKKVPLWGLIVTNDVENSPYTNYTGKSKDIYLSVDIYESESLNYCSTIKKCFNCIDCVDLEDSEQSYNCAFSRKLFNCKNVNFSKGCSFSNHLNFCEGVNNSYFCVGLNNKNYCILNKQYSKEKYNNIINSIDFFLYFKKYKELLKSFPKKSLFNISSENIFGDNLINSSNSYNCFDSINIKNCKYISVGHSMENCMDTTIHNIDCYNDYEAISGGKLKKSGFNILGWGGKNMYYNQECIDSKDCFGCIGLKNKSYCILNKEYTKEEYNKLVPKIIEKMKLDGEWGEFFPSNISPFGYNETVAQEYFPLSKDSRDVWQKHLFNWSYYESPKPNVSKIIPASKLPEKISDIPDDILNWAIECEITKKPFIIIKQELEFYRKHNLPIPKKHPDQRHLERMELRNPRKLFDRKCDKCSVDMKTTYSPEREEIVYCKKCYEKEIY